MSTDLLVISAHAADYVWRAGGMIGQYVRQGKSVQIIALSYGERGESAELWKSGKNLMEVKAARRAESQQAAEILGAPIRFLDWDDYPLNIGQERLLDLVRIIRDLQPRIILTHGNHDPFNPDHVTAAEMVHKASVLAIARGVLPELPVATQVKLFGFEHHQPELSQFHPDIIVDITDAYEVKKQAMDCFQTQQHLIEYYAMRAFVRGNHARRISGNNKYRYAEAFMRYYPLIAEELL